MAEGASVKEGMLGSEDVGKGRITQALKVRVTELGFSQLGDWKPLMTLRQVSATVGLRFHPPRLPLWGQHMLGSRMVTHPAAPFLLW